MNGNANESMEIESGRAPGAELYAEHCARYARLLGENPDRALEEYGFTFVNSVHESDSAVFLKELDLAEPGWRQDFLEAVALHRRGKLDEAEKRYKDLLKQSKDHQEIEYNMAVLQWQRGDAEASEKHIKVFEGYLDSVEQTNVFVDECRGRVKALREELSEL